MTRYNKFITTLPASVFLLALAAAAPSALAQSGPPGDAGPGMRYCVLLGMLGGNLPPECLDEDEQHDYSAELDQLRLATVAFHSHDVAAAAGWNAPISECVEAPPGGMGYHVANLDYLADGGKLSLLQPEVLLYAPTEDGSMAFLGVEYIIPAEDWPHEEAPQFFGRELHFNPNLDIWALHVWSARENPAGLFEDFNPEVDCAFAED
ncbi:hypothetical protein [Wenzhouxiangella sp. EGI_FJ10305]|uniref:hypothetical protein n=1 Tax=Wenzhouxiangella sp. EGI_FJ10305 TaxID=3243768 RepID=UPI0035E137A0